MHGKVWVQSPRWDGMSEPFDLERFVREQDGGSYDRALAEERAGRKRTH